MAALRVALLVCALISSALLGPAKAQAQTPPIAPTDAAQTAMRSAAQPAMQAVARGGELSGTTLAAPAPALVLRQWTLPPQVWSAGDRMPSANFESLDSGAGSSALASDNCRWTLGVENDWNCKIKPLTGHEFPIRSALDRLWPFHRAGNGR